MHCNNHKLPPARTHVTCTPSFHTWPQPPPTLLLHPRLQKHGFKSVSEFKGHSLPYFTTHTDLVARQRAALEAKKARVGLASDEEWRGDKFVEQSAKMVAN